MNKLVLWVLSFCLCYDGVVSWQLFRRGRFHEGSLPAPEVTVNKLPEEQWFQQKLDHFDASNVAQWKQRYFVNDTFFDKKNGPVFLMIGGEAEANPKWMVNGTWLRYAAKYNALCLMLEHRFYGKSHPVSDLATKGLSYLSSEQALSDIANFIVSYNEKLGRIPKWIVFGGSYPGSLAAWMRLKYPHLVLGAVSSSGPLLAVADFKEYFRVVEDALLSYDKNCVPAIQEGTRQITSLMAHRVGQQTLFKLFELCDPIDPDNKNDIANLYESFADNFAGIVQYNKDNRHVSNQQAVDVTIDLVCDIMTNKSAGSEVDRLAIINSILLRNGNESCLDYKYNKMIKDLSSTDWSSKSAAGMRQWTYQTCTEFGFFQTSELNSTKLLFGSLFPVEFFIQQCRDIYGDKFNRDLLEAGIRRTNMIYGGYDLHADNVVYVHGSVDPWHALGITKTLREKAPAIFIEGTAHCADMYPSSAKDLPQLSAARNEIEKLIGVWLKKTD